MPDMWQIHQQIRLGGRTQMKLTISPQGLVNNKESWNDDVSTQQLVRTAVHTVLEELDQEVLEEWELDDGSIEIESHHNNVIYRGTANPNATNSEFDGFPPYYNKVNESVELENVTDDWYDEEGNLIP